MINNEKWLDSLHKTHLGAKDKSPEINNNKWIETLPKKNTFNSVKKYSLISIFFIGSLIFVSVLKNETRNLEKEINYLKASISSAEYDLDQAILDNEVITSPENISKLAKEYLDSNLAFYQKHQIQNLNHINSSSEKESNKNKLKNLNNLSKNVKVKVAKKIETKKKELKKLQNLYDNPKNIPSEIKTKVSKQIRQKKFELRNLYESPSEILSMEKVSKWGMVQVVKAFLGIPVLPGR